MLKCELNFVIKVKNGVNIQIKYKGNKVSYWTIIRDCDFKLIYDYFVSWDEILKKCT